MSEAQHDLERLVKDHARLLDEIARLWEAIRAEAEKHNIFNKPECDCRICRIAREER